jgi:hypothetical protein
MHGTIINWLFGAQYVVKHRQNVVWHDYDWQEAVVRGRNVSDAALRFKKKNPTRLLADIRTKTTERMVNK